MTTKDIEDLIQRVRRWPKERQEDAAQLLLALEARGVWNQAAGRVVSGGVR